MYLTELESSGSNILKAEAGVDSETLPHSQQRTGAENVLSKSGVHRKDL